MQRTRGGMKKRRHGSSGRGLSKRCVEKTKTVERQAVETRYRRGGTQIKDRANQGCGQRNGLTRETFLLHIGCHSQVLDRALSRNNWNGTRSDAVDPIFTWELLLGGSHKQKCIPSTARPLSSSCTPAGFYKDLGNNKLWSQPDFPHSL